MERYHKLDAEQSLSAWLSMLHRASSRFLADKLKHHGLGRGDAAILAAVYEHQDASQEDIAKALYVDKGTAAKALAALERKGFISRQNDPRDKRVKRIQPTAKAIEIQADLHKAQSLWTELTVKGFTPVERRQALYLLYRMAANAEQWRL